MRGLSRHFPKSKKDALKRSPPPPKHNSRYSRGCRRCTRATSGSADGRSKRRGAGFSAARPNCHDTLPTREGLSGRCPRCAAATYAPRSPLPKSSAGRGGQPDLQVSSLHHQSLWNVGKYAAERLLDQPPATRSAKTRRPPRASCSEPPQTSA